MGEMAVGKDDQLPRMEKVKIMSVRMALAKLCACTCGGAIIGGGAVQVGADAPGPAAYSQVQKVSYAKKRLKSRKIARQGWTLVAAHRQNQQAADDRNKNRKREPRGRKRSHLARHHLVPKIM